MKNTINIFRPGFHRALLLPALLFAAAPCRAILNGEGQDIFPVPAVFQSSAAITYTSATNPGLTVSSGMVVSDGNFGIGLGFPGARLHINTLADSSIGQIVQAAAAQAADLTQWLNSGGSPMLLVDRWGRLSYGTEVALQGAGISLLTTDVDQVGLVIRGIGGQNEDLQRWQGVGGVNLMVVKANGNIGISTGAPQARLEIVAAGSAHTDMAQLWRAGGGNIVSSLSATGVMTAAYFEGDGSGLTGLEGNDNLGNHVATTTLQMGNFGIVSSSDITAARYQVDGSTLLAKLRGANSLGVGLDAGQASTADDNSFAGYQAGYATVGGGKNTFLGSLAGYTNTAGADNVFAGYKAGYFNTAAYNTLIGSEAGLNNSGGAGNVFVGYQSGYNGGAGGSNAFIGYQAGYSNGAGTDNSIMGYQAAYTNTGSNNSIIGSHAGYYNEGAGNNSFFGSYSGFSNTTGDGNSLFGFYSGGYISNASGNSAFGAGAAKYTNGSANAVFGAEAGGYGNGAAGNFSSATIVGYQAGNKLQTGASDNVLIGFKAGYAITTGTGNIVIGYAEDTSAAGVNNELNIGGALFGKLDTRVIGIGRQIPQAALDVVSTASAHAQMAQIWRNSGGSIVSSMSATGVMKAIRFVGDGSGLVNVPASDNLGNHTATDQLNMNNFAIISSSDITAAHYQIDGVNVLFTPPGSGNIAVGIDAGVVVNASGYSNSFFGYQAGYATIDTYSNTFIGYQSGFANDGGSGYGYSNTFVGSLSGAGNTSGNNNTFMGAAAGNLNSIAGNNTFIGFNAGTSNSSGESNTFLGASAGYSADDSYNTYIGVNAGLYSTTGGYNTVLGAEAGNGTSSGSTYINSTLIGFQAGYGLEDGRRNTFLGYKAGDAVTGGSDNVIIGYDEDASDPNANYELNIGGAIFGDLSAAKNISIGSMAYLSSYKFSVDGTGYLNDAAWTYSSDRRLKENITPILSGLDIIGQLKPVRFDYKKGSKKQAGFIAQEVREVLPDIVTENSKGMLGMKTEAIIPYLVKAVQEQQKEIEELKSQLKARQ